MTTLTARSGPVEFGPGLPIVIINDQLRVMDQAPGVLAALRAGQIDPLIDLARRGAAAGAQFVDILIAHPDLDEIALLPSIAVAVHEALGCPISLDSRDPQALDAALSALEPYKGLVNSVSAEPEVLEALLPIAARHHAAVVGMPIGRVHGLPRTVAGRLSEARTILDAAWRCGIPREDVVIDAICLASAAEPASMQVTLETLQAIHQELGVATILGIGNAGHGMPDPRRIDLAYLISAASWGLDAALLDPATPGLIETVRAADFLTGRDPEGRGYLKQWRQSTRRRQA